jgi:predicted secreted protein
MKRIISVILVLMIITTGVFADIVPTLIKDLPFELEQSGDEFTIILEENPTTGYVWTYEFDETNVEYISDEYVSESNMMGASGHHKYTFKVLKDGVSTIEFDLNRSFEENSSIDSLSVLVYKNGEKVFVEENGIVTIAEPVVISEPVYEVFISEKKLELDTNPQIIDGVHMIPVAETLRALGYEVTWNNETKSVEIFKGAQWTSIKIGENAYFKNRMAASPLSAAPIIINGRTMVPTEFFYEILNIGLQLEGSKISFTTYEMGTYEGYVKEITETNGNKSYHMVFNKEKQMADVVIHTSLETTIFQKDVQVGDKIRVLTSMATTMSLPPQTSGFIIY